MTPTTWGSITSWLLAIVMALSHLEKVWAGVFVAFAVAMMFLAWWFEDDEGGGGE